MSPPMTRCSRWCTRLFTFREDTKLKPENLMLCWKSRRTTTTLLVEILCMARTSGNMCKRASCFCVYTIRVFVSIWQKNSMLPYWNMLNIYFRQFGSYNPVLNPQRWNTVVTAAQGQSKYNAVLIMQPEATSDLTRAWNSDFLLGLHGICFFSRYR